MFQGLLIPNGRANPKGLEESEISNTTGTMNKYLQHNPFPPPFPSFLSIILILILAAFQQYPSIHPSIHPYTPLQERVSFWARDFLIFFSSSIFSPYLLPLI